MLNAPPRPGERFGRFRIVGLVGHGGMGTVYEALQEGLGRRVALKVLSPQFSAVPEYRSRFTREANALAALDSPHVIQVYDYGEEDGQLYIAAQLIAGPDLQRCIDERGAVPYTIALSLAAQLASGLADAHAAGLLHRDVKPSNVLLRDLHGDQHAYLCDFGIARVEDDANTSTTGVAGTVGYMAPERHDGAPATVVSDVYSLGCVLWAMVSGRAPYAGKSGVKLALAHMQEPVSVLDDPTRAGHALNQVLSRSMAKSPGDRYTSALDMRRDLLRVMDVVRDQDAHELQGASYPRVMNPSGPVTEVRAPRVVPEPSSRATKRGRGMAIGVVLAGVVGAVGIGGYYLAGGSAAPADDKAMSDGRQAASKKVENAGQDGRASNSGSRGTSAGGQVTCWDGQSATDATLCSVPTGRAGLKSVFPSMDTSCRAAALRVPGKEEVFECNYGAFVIRYSRWKDGTDRMGYLGQANRVAGQNWTTGDELAGLQWTSVEDDPRERQPFQWSATYRDQPFSVSIEGITAEGREEGKAMFQAEPPSEVRLQ